MSAMNFSENRPLSITTADTLVAAVASHDLADILTFSRDTLKSILDSDPDDPETVRLLAVVEALLTTLTA